MVQHGLKLLPERRGGQALSGPQEMDDLPQKPRPATAAAADHHAVGSRFGETLLDLLERGDVAVCNHRDVHRLLHFSDELPVRPSPIELAAGAPVDRDHLNAAVLGDFGKAGRVACALVPTGPHLQRHRQVNRLDRGLEDARGVDLVTHQSRSGVALDHFLDRTAEVDIDDRGPPVLVELGRLRHDLGLVAGELNRHGVLLGAVRRHFHGPAGPADHGLAGDHLGDDKPGAQALDQTAERHVRHPGHGRQDDSVLQGYGADLNAHFLGRVAGGGHYLGNLAAFPRRRNTNGTGFTARPGRGTVPRVRLTPTTHRSRT